MWLSQPRIQDLERDFQAWSCSNLQGISIQAVQEFRRNMIKVWPDSEQQHVDHDISSVN